MTGFHHEIDACDDVTKMVARSIQPFRKSKSTFARTLYLLLCFIFGFNLAFVQQCLEFNCLEEESTLTFIVLKNLRNTFTVAGHL